MRAWTVHRPGPYRDVLRLEERPDPVPGPGQVLIRVRAAGLNFPDLLITAGSYQVRPPCPFIPGFEAAGEIVSAPEGCDLAPGRRVVGFCETGAFAEQVAIDERDVFPIPEGMPDDQAAAFLVPFQTGLFALERRARLGAGEVLLVHGAAGGVGSAAVQLGKALGATVIAAAGTAAKRAWCLELGADHAVDSRDDFAAAVRDLTGGHGADVVLDPVGGDAFDHSLRCLAWEGRLVTVGFASGRIPTVKANRLLLRNVAVVGLYWGDYRHHDPAAPGAAYRRLAALYRAGAIRPVVHERYPMAALPEGLAAIEARRVRGKAVLQVSPEPPGGAAATPAARHRPGS